MTVADYANSDPAVVKSGRVKKAVANAVQQEGEHCVQGACPASRHAGRLPPTLPASVLWGSSSSPCSEKTVWFDARK